MSYRHVFISAVLLAIAIFTIPTCLPYLLSTTSWSSPLLTPYRSRAGAAQDQSPNEAAVLMSDQRNGRPKLDHLTLMASVPHEYLPSAHNQRRLIVIGDIHGMNTELGHLLDAAQYDSSRDHVITLGDMVNKGPDSRGVLARLMAMNASAVRGNHEDRLLLALDDYNSRAAPAQYAGGGGGGDDDDYNGDRSRVIEARKRNKKILKVAKTLTSDQVRWLSHLPVILEAKSLQLYFVHAGLVPGVRLDKQDPWVVMNMRSLVWPEGELRRNGDKAINSDALPEQERDLLLLPHEEEKEEENNGNDNDDDNVHDQDYDHDNVQGASKAIAVPVDDHSGERWAKAWDRYAKHLSKSARWTVMYGHDARQGFTEGKYAVGLDSACVRGGFLTGLIVEADSRRGAPFTYTKIQVPCKQHA
ncbi:hypothetical protein E4U54_006554 [Claviceps lovelessii]|nr:hypothetical protein E4U54_006554 [Claviceps lovelessii]